MELIEIQLNINWAEFFLEFNFVLPWQIKWNLFRCLLQPKLGNRPEKNWAVVLQGRRDFNSPWCAPSAHEHFVWVFTTCDSSVIANRTVFALGKLWCCQTDLVRNLALQTYFRECKHYQEHLGFSARNYRQSIERNSKALCWKRG